MLRDPSNVIRSAREPSKAPTESRPTTAPSVGITRQSNPPLRMSNSKLPFVIRFEPGRGVVFATGIGGPRQTRSPTIVPAPYVESAHRNRERPHASQKASSVGEHEPKPLQRR